MNPYGSDRRKKADLKSRLYDSGISYYPMPSVVRPIEANSGVKSFMANTNAPKDGRGKNRSKLRMQGDMSVDYARESQIPNMKANMSMEYTPNDLSGYGAHNTMLSKAYGDTTPYGDISTQQERIKRAMRGGYNSFNQSITGIKTATELKPALQVKQNSKLMGRGSMYGTSGIPSKLPPLKRGDSQKKQRFPESPDKSSMMQEQMYYDDFGATNISMVPMTEQARSKIFSCPLEWKKRKVEITKIRAGEEDEDFERDQDIIQGKPVAKELTSVKQAQSAANNKEWVDLDKFIELLLDSKSEDEIVFIYCNPNPNGDPYDLQVCAYDERNEDKYYTMSGKGLSCHEGDHVTEFISLAQWLINRDSYNHIKELRFFKKFKKWKFMRIWKDTIKKEARKQATNKLKDKLFILHDTFKTHLLTHRDYCKKMEDLRFVDFGSNLETQKIKKFAENQEKARKNTQTRISQFSSKCRENIEACINKVLQDLKQRIDAETKLDEERKRVNPIQSTTTLAVKDKQSHNVFEELGFPPGMTYGHCSSLREECSRFIRFAYLVDFMCYESLSGIYLGSIEAITNRLRYLDQTCKIDELMKMDLNDANNAPAAPVRGHDPLFLVSMELNSEKPIPEAEIVKEELEDFKPPPHGKSEPDDFDLISHLELEPEPEEGKEEASDEEEAVDELFVKKYRDTCPNIHKHWLKLTPSREDFSNLFEKMFISCNNEIKAFERFSKHPSMKIYADALEEWDDRIGDNWDAPDDLMLDPVEWIKDNKVYTDKTTNINNILMSTYEKAERFTSRFKDILEHYWMDKRCDFNIVVHQRLKNPTDSLQHVISLLLFQDELFARNIPASTTVGLIKLDSKKMKNMLIPVPKQCMQKIEEIVPQTIKDRLEEADKWLTDCTRKLSKPAGTVDEFVEQNANLTYTNENFQSVRDKVALYEQYFNIMANSGIKGVKDDSLSAGRALDRNKNLLTNVVQSITKLANLIMNVENFQDSKLDQFRKTFDDLIPKLNTDIEDVHKEATDEIFLSGDAEMPDVLRKLDGLEEKYNKLEKTSTKYQSWQEVLQINQSSFENLDELRDDLKIRADMWRSLSTWEDKQAEWVKLQFSKIDAKKISEEADQYAKVANRVEKTLPSNPIGEKLKLLVDTFRGTMPVVVALRNSDIQESHMQEIKDLLQNDFDILDEHFTLNSLIEMNVVQFQEEIETISTQASQEASLRRQLNELDEQWKKIDLITKPYKDGEMQILDEIEDVFTALDDSLAKINTILGSRYVKPLRAEAEGWKKHLFILNQIIEEWVTCQKQWIYLENILKSPDIKRHLPNESARFEKIDQNFKKLMDRTKKAPSAIKMVKGPGGQQLLDQLKNNNEQLEEIQKKLEEYLEKKRGDFPRFYFLSNDELLEILANSQNMEVIQQNLKTCFDNIYRLEIEEDSQAIKAMYSGEGEKVPFAKKPTARGQVEVWLNTVQEAMRDTLQKLMKQGVADFENPNINRKEWIQCHFGQIVATVSQIVWCATTEESINRNESDPDALSECLEMNKSQLKDLTALVRGKLSSVQRKIIVALVTTDVHARDIVQKLCDTNVCSTNEFEWQKQLRYYWDYEKGDCQIKQVNAVLNYGYEYMGATSRLVITPLTDRCWITITGAIHIKLGANPAGPAGTGKTESTKDLAKAIGVQCIVFNCSEQVDYKMMGRLFSGLAQQGCWTCLDEFNRIDIEVLSVIAQQLATIRQALLNDLENFLFEGNHIPLIKTVAVCVTMNPGYAGRTELPDNLKVLFRPVSMMIPDYALIAEIMLFAEGFDSATVLSKKMVKLYKLASEQLSQQDHYDFGMRAVKSVLVMAGALKRANPDMKEDAVLIRAMRDSNVPKFLRDDLPLFGAIVQDLFPTVEIRDADYGSLQEQIEASIKEKLLQTVPEFILKVIQLFDTFEVRFGVMIVGPTGAGKTTCYEVLQHAMTELRKRNSPDERFQLVTTNVLNPKSISMGELYGEVNEVSQEWTDGLASKIMRNAAGEQGDDRTWVVFDGPVDALWIENMNTVLDDNMTLCLANGQRLKLRHQMRMLFEVQDLAVASPATVSRCGMVYMTPEDLSWRPYIKSRIARYYKDDSILDDFLKQYLYETFDQTLDQAMERIENGLVEPVETVPVQRATNIMNFLESMLRPEYGFKGTREEKQKKINSLFVWCYAWGVGGALDQFGKDRIDDCVKDVFKSVKVPSTGTIFDYWYDANKKEPTFVAWKDKVPAFEYDPSLPYFQLMVPTVDTFRYAFVLEMLYQYSTKPIFFTGVSGVGKSVIIQNLLADMKESKGVQTININFSAQTTSMRTQLTIEDKLEKKRRTLFGAGPGKSIAVFVDDVNMPAVEQYGAQPPIELLRLFVDRSGLYDRTDLYWKEVEDTTVICCAAPPGGGRNKITPRFTRHFNVFCLPTSSKEVLQTIFNSILGGFLKNGFMEDVKKLCEPCVDATIEIYHRIAEELRPTPARFHYLFNLRDVSRVIQGILMTKPVSCQSPETFSRLWVNEMSRVFKDRLIDENDRDWFDENATELVNQQFRIRIDKNELFNEQTIMWGDLLKLDAPVKLYEEIKDKNKLFKQLENSLEDYNMSNTGKMNLVFFDDCMDHILRISRILRQPRGNAMMIGVGGSGKQSATRLASHMLEIEFKQIEITKRFGPQEFKEFIKELMFTTGIDRTPICFTLTDNQIISEVFVEDINAILNTGEISNLMEPEDKDKIVDGVRPLLAQMGRVDTLENINATFIEGVRDFLHINLCMSPVGDSLRIRCRMFPSLVNCCTIDWFSRWPESALYYVSSEFLSDLHLTNEENRNGLAEMCMMIHTSVEEMSEEFFRTLRRRVYTTPKSYLDLINLYLSALEQKRTEFNINKTRLSTGIKKLTDTNTNIAELREKIKVLQPQLQKKNEDLKVSLKKATEDRKIADQKEEVVTKEATVVNQQADEAQAIVDDVQRELDLVQPELDAAKASLAKLDKSKITEIKSFPNPPDAVVMVMEAVMIVFGEKTEWNHVKKVISDPKAFVDSMKSFDIKTLDGKKLSLLRKKYISRKDFKPADVETKSVAAKSMCEWVLALDKYSDVLKKVAPKQAQYEEVSGVLKVAKDALAVKQAELKEVTDKVAALEAACLSMEEEKRSLEEEMDRCEKRMGRAEKLVVLLEDEGIRWKETVEIMEKEIEELVGNVFISAACIAYFGAFTGVYREKLVSQWVAATREKGIPVAENFDLIKIMGDPVTIRGWGIASLPTDKVSIENGILATQAQRWPLMIDPEEQANKWIRNIGKQENLEVLKFSTPNFLRTLGGSISIGRPVLVEDIGETLDPGIDPILLKQMFKSGSGIKQIRIGDGNLDYDDNFKFYMTTKLPNPHYLPEVCIKVTLINFSVTFKGLEDQMLGDVVVQEKPEVEKKRDEVVVTMDKDQRTLKQIEITILKLLSESQIEEILDEDNLINILEDSKKTSKEIFARIQQSEEVEIEINETRNQYKSVAVRGSVLYFVIADLSKIDPMYQYSLGYVKKLFNLAIEKSESRDTQEERIKLLIKNITSTLYTSVARGLFEADKITFSFLIATSINRECGLIADDTWRTLLVKSVKIPSDVVKKQRKNPDKQGKYLSTISWETIYFIDTVLSRDFDGIMDDICDNYDDWYKWADSEDPHLVPLPGDWEEKLTRINKLIIIKCWRYEKLLFAITEYVKDELGDFYIKAPPSAMDDVFPDTDRTTPFIYILSVGADPTSILYKFATKKNYMDKLSSISLGQGQGPKAEALIERAKKNGEWVMLQNCHLAKSWISTKLETIVNNLAFEADTIEENFRLFLTSMPADYFPVSVLQNGVKLTTEPPRGLKANLRRSYDGLISEQQIEDSKSYVKKMIFGLCFFHAQVQERRKFGPLGWNIRYEFNDSDLETSLTMLPLLLEDQEDVPWDSLLFVIGEITYGGRVTDDLDIRCLMSMLNMVLTPKIQEDDYKFSDSGIYYPPNDGSHKTYTDYIEGLPLKEEPEVFGMHPNTNINFQLQESDRIVTTVMSIQPRVATAAGGKSPDELIIEKCNDIQEKLPQLLDRALGKKELFKTDSKGLLPSLSTVLTQEIERFNKLLKVMGASLVDLVKAIQGFIVMSEELDTMYNALTNGIVPPNWEKVAYPSLKPFATWFLDLIERVKFMDNWLVNGEPPCFWMSGFFFPQGFMTGVLQTHARKEQIAIDKLNFSFKILEEEPEHFEEGPESGVYIYGLFFDGARWDDEAGVVADQYPGILYDKAPVIWFEPMEDYKPDPEEYSCPVYKTSVRAGVLSTTGQSTNYILSVDLPTKMPPAHWIRRGAALLCQLND